MDGSLNTAGLGPLMKRVAAGWSETDDRGNRQFVLAIELDEDGLGAEQNWILLTRTLAAVTAVTGNGTKLAELKLDGLAAVAPSVVKESGWRLTAGEFAQPLVISVSELLGLGAAMEIASAQRDDTGLCAVSVHDLDARTAQARDSFNRTADESRLLREFRLLGWHEEKVFDSVRQLRAPGWGPDTAATVLFGGDLLPGGGVVTPTDFPITDVFPALSALRPFDVLAHLKYAGDYEATAEALLETGEARVRLGVFSASRIVEIDEEQPTMDIVGQIVSAIGDARASFNDALPLAAQKVVPGAGVVTGLVSVSPSGELRTHHNADELIAGAVQLVRFSKANAAETGERWVTERRHTVPNPIKDSVWQHLLQRGQLPTVEYVDEQPIITRAGTVVSEAGYHPAERTLLAIPRKDRARFASVQVGRPTQEAAQAALDWVRQELTCDFAFETPGDEARYFAFLLTSVGRGITELSPLFLMSGKEMGSGKTLLMQLAMRVALGARASAASWKGGRNEDEDLKNLVGAVSRAAGKTVFFHNDEARTTADSAGRIQHMLLTRLVTTPDGGTAERVLGGNQLAPICGVIATAAGNQISPGADLSRRTLTISLVVKGGIAATQRTEWRHADLLGWAEANREQVLTALFTILAFGLQNPVDVPGYGFAPWAKVVLSSLAHVRLGERPMHELAMDRYASDIDGDQLSEEWGPLIAQLSGDSAGSAFVSGDARIWAGFAEVQLPAALARIRATETEAGVNRAWSHALKSITMAKVTDGDFRYRLAEDSTNSGKATKRYVIERWDLAGKDAPEHGTRKSTELPGQDF